MCVCVYVVILPISTVFGLGFLYPHTWMSEKLFIGSKAWEISFKCGSIEEDLSGSTSKQGRSGQGLWFTWAEFMAFRFIHSGDAFIRRRIQPKHVTLLLRGYSSVLVSRRFKYQDYQHNHYSIRGTLRNRASPLTLICLATCSGRIQLKNVLQWKSYGFCSGGSSRDSSNISLIVLRLSGE